jgi:putative endonuclease
MTRGATRKNGVTNFARGVWAERIATLYIWCKGYRLRARRYKTPLGEIDLIATRGRTIVFFEIKARGTIDDARTAIAPASYTRLHHAAEIFIIRHPKFAAYTMRFDLIALAPPCHIVHLDNIDLNAA